MLGGNLLHRWGYRLHVLLCRILPEHHGPIIVHPMRRGVLLSLCKRCNELHKLSRWKLLQCGRAVCRIGNMRGGNLRRRWGCRVHTMLGRLLLELQRQIILHPMLPGLLRKPCKRSNELHKLSRRKLLRYNRAHSRYGDLCGWLDCRWRGHRLLELLARLVPERREQGFLQAVPFGLLCLYRRSYNLPALPGWKLLRYDGGTVGKLDLRCGDLLNRRGHRLHLLLSRILPGRHGPIILHPMRRGLLHKPWKRSNDLHELSLGKFLCDDRADIYYGELLAGDLLVECGRRLHHVFGGLVPKCAELSFLYAMRFGLLY